MKMAHSTLHQMFALCELAFCSDTSVILEKIVKQNLTCGSNLNCLFQTTGLKRDHNSYSIHSMKLYHVLSQGHTVRRKKAKYNRIWTGSICTEIKWQAFDLLVLNVHCCKGKHEERPKKNQYQKHKKVIKGKQKEECFLIEPGKENHDRWSCFQVSHYENASLLQYMTILGDSVRVNNKSVWHYRQLLWFTALIELQQKSNFVVFVYLFIIYLFIYYNWGLQLSTTNSLSEFNLWTMEVGRKGSALISCRQLKV